MDWKKTIGIAYLVREQLAQADIEQIFPFHMPEVRADESTIAQAERELGFDFDQSYRAFLACANGWQSFYQANDLFGTQDLTGGTRMERAVTLLDALFPLSDVCGVEEEELLPIAVSSTDIDLFLLSRSRGSSKGKVFWCAGQLVETFENFEEFFLAMVDYNRADLADFKRASV
jgi:hypothetical protein